MIIETKWLIKLLDAYINEAGLDLPASFSYEKLYEGKRFITNRIVKLQLL